MLNSIPELSVLIFGLRNNFVLKSALLTFLLLFSVGCGRGLNTARQLIFGIYVDENQPNQVLNNSNFKGRLNPDSLPKKNKAPSSTPVEVKKFANNISKLVVIDPGHGGLDGGTVQPKKSGHAFHSLVEKDVVLDISKELKAALAKDYGIKTELTRKSDLKMDLPLRTQAANRLNADVFVSLHVNSSGKGLASGFEVYYLDAEGDRSAMRLAKVENSSSSGGSIDDLQFILSDLVQTGKLHDSIILAHSIEAEIGGSLSRKWPKVKSLGVKKAPFYVLVGARMPCVLLELFFIDHPVDSKLLSQTAFRKDLARAVARGINNFLARS